LRRQQELDVLEVRRIGVRGRHAPAVEVVVMEEVTQVDLDLGQRRALGAEKIVR